jgi:ABC-type phosphate/phosphonate transport system substrate-binding protein
MAACDKTTKWIQRVLITSGGGGVPIVFPTTLIAKTQGTNTLVPLAAGDNTVLAANANRKFAQIANFSGTTQYIAFGAAASTSSLALPSGSIFTIEPDTIGEINQQAVHVWSVAGGVNLSVYEE